MFLAGKVNAFLNRPPVLIGLLFGIIVIAALAFLPGKGELPSHDLRKISRQGEIIFITQYNPHCYYRYRDQAMGFEYELAKAFAEDLGVRLTLKIAGPWEDMARLVQTGKGHIIAANMTVTPERAAQVAFSDGYLTTRQHIIAHRDNHAVRHVQDLAGLTVQVGNNAVYQKQLTALQEQGIDLTINSADQKSTMEILRDIEAGETHATVAYSHVAKLNQRNFPHIFIADAVGNEEQLAWGVHPEAEALRKRINLFFRAIKTDGVFDEIYNRYYSSAESLNFVDLRSYHRFLATRLPQYGRIIKSEAENHGFDWRLIAAQIYQESRFQPDALSPAGAYGLMQLTKRTARSHGVSDPGDPIQNIRAGIRQLKRLYDLFDDAEGADRIFIALGAYNVGQGHIRDAQRLARKKGYDPTQWASLVKVLPLLQQEEYFEEAVYGYCQGTEPVRYVRQIIIFYDILKHKSIQFKPDETSLPDMLPGPAES